MTGHTLHRDWLSLVLHADGLAEYRDVCQRLLRFHRLVAELHDVDAAGEQVVDEFAE